MNSQHEYYEWRIGGEADALWGKVRLASANLGKYNWYAASAACSPLPSIPDMTVTGWLSACEARMNGETMEDSLRIGMREVTRLAYYDGAGNIMRAGGEDRPTIPMVMAQAVIQEDMVPLWYDDTSQEDYLHVEDEEVSRQIRYVVDVTLEGVEHTAVSRFLFDADTDERGWQSKMATEYGLSREGFRRQLKRGLEKVGEAWTLEISGLASS
jgi:hypothetical protein